MIKVAIQTDDFNLQHEVQLLEQDNKKDGAVVTFTGRVRDNNLGENVTALFLEHYPGMTESSLQNIIEQAKTRWQLGNISVIHRVGRLKLGEQIVFVGVTSKHRSDAFLATEFIMDYLKVDAPFWKKEQTEDGEYWLDAKQSDQQQANRWLK